MGWFRLHDTTLDNPKVQRLKPELFKAWINLLCVANRRGGTLPSELGDLAFEMRVPVAKARTYFDALLTAGLLDQGETIKPHDWDEHQYIEPTGTSAAALRQKRYRDRHSARNAVTPEALRVTSRNGVTQTGPLSEQNTEQNRREGEGVTPSRVTPEASRTEPASPRTEGGSSAPPAPERRATRLVIEALPPEWRAFAVETRPDLDPEATWQRFRDYWIAKPGKDGRKLDWQATWRNWVRSERRGTQASLELGNGNAKSSSASRGRDVAAAALEVGERLDRDAELQQRPGVQDG